MGLPENDCMFFDGKRISSNFPGHSRYRVIVSGADVGSLRLGRYLATAWTIFILQLCVQASFNFGANRLMNCTLSPPLLVLILNYVL